MSVSAGGLALAQATSSSAGAMSAADKVKLDTAADDIAEIKNCLVWTEMGNE